MGGQNHSNVVGVHYFNRQDRVTLLKLVGDHFFFFNNLNRITVLECMGGHCDFLQQDKYYC